MIRQRALQNPTRQWFHSYEGADFLRRWNDLGDAKDIDTTTTFGNLTGTDKWIGGILAPNGCIYGIPRNSTTVLKIDPATDTISTFGNLTGTAKWAGGILAPNGCIYGIPYNSTAVLKIDPATDTISTFGSVGTGTAKWIGGILAPNGCIYGIPRNSTTVLKIDPDDHEVALIMALQAYVNKF